MRYFKKISFDQFKKDIDNNLELYNNFQLPARKTTNSAGYDFHLLKNLTLKPNEIAKIPTGVKSFMQSNEVLLIIIRSSLGFKYNIRLCNQVGVIDSDYYNNSDNEGHIYMAIKNEGTQTLNLKEGDAIAQGIFINYLTSRDSVDTKRKGGIGSTNE